MKKVAVIIDNLGLGGIPKATVSLVNELVIQADVTVVLSENTGPLINQISEKVRILTIPTETVGAIIKGFIKRGRVFKAAGLALSHFYHSRISRKWIKNAVAKAKYRGAILNEHFDIAIANHGMNIPQMLRVIYGICADKKIAWTHGLHPFSKKEMLDAQGVYSLFDVVFSDSDATNEYYKREFPSIKDKFHLVYDILATEPILNGANEVCDVEMKGEINLLSVGRVSQEKGYDMVPEITRLLVDRGYPVRFYIVGDGPDMPRLKEKIEEYAVGEYVIPLGAKTNPYPYMRDCDIYVQPSYEESYGITICEAGVLGKAVVCTTSCGGISEKVKDGESALFAETTPIDIADKIEKIIVNEELRRKLEKNIKIVDFTNNQEIDKILK